MYWLYFPVSTPDGWSSFHSSSSWSRRCWPCLSGQPASTNDCYAQLPTGRPARSSRPRCLRLLCPFLWFMTTWCTAVRLAERTIHCRAVEKGANFTSCRLIWVDLKERPPHSSLHPCQSFKKVKYLIAAVYLLIDESVCFHFFFLNK